MTERELLIAYVTFDVDKFAAAFGSLSEVERTQLLGVLVDFLERGIYTGEAKGRVLFLHDDFQWLSSYIQEKKPDGYFYNDALAKLALGDFNHVKLIWMSNFSGERAASLIRVMRDRRPSWAQKWFDSELKRGGASWEIMQELIACGLWQRREGPDYYRCMSSGLAGLAHRRAKVDPQSEGISEYLRQHPDFLSLVYELFSIEAGSFLNSREQWTGSARWPGETWTQALKRLSEEGLLDRKRLLQLSISSQLLDFKAYRLTGLADFHEGMVPSPEELAALQPYYCAILSAERDSVAAFGIKMLGKVEKAKFLDDDAYVSAAVAVLDRKSKGMAKAVLTQFRKIGKRSPHLLPEILHGVANRGLTHGEADVQEASLGLLEYWSGSLDTPTREAIRERIDDLPLTLQTRARALAGVECTTVPMETRPATRSEKRRASKSTIDLPGPWRALAGVDAAIEAVEGGTMPPPLYFDAFEVPVLSGVKPVAAVESMDTLFDLVSRYVMGKFSAMDLERMLDGISRLDRAASKDFLRLAAPVAARLAPYPVRRDAVDECVRYWLTGDPSTVGVLIEGFHRSNPPDAESSIEDFHRERVFEMTRRLARGVHAPLLSLPTHEGGWIAVEALAARLRDWRSRGLVPEKFDLIQTLLRLAPEGREDAASALDPSDDGWARAIRWALTGDGQALKGDDPDVWLAAARSRAPHGVVAVPGLEDVEMPAPAILSEVGADRNYFMDWLRSLRTKNVQPSKRDQKLDGHVIPGPDGGTPARFELIPNGAWREAVAARNAMNEAARLALYKKEGVNERGRDFFDLKVESRRIVPGIERLQEQLAHRFGVRVTPPWIEGCGAVARPTVLLQKFANVKYDRRQEAAELEWAALCWPHHLDAFFASGLVNISLTFDWSTTKVWPEHAFLTPLFEPDRPFSLPAAMLVCLSLCAPPGDLSRAAIDVLVEGIADGRVHPAPFAEPVARIAETPWFQFGRFTTNLAEVARVSPHHTWTVRGILEALIAPWTDLPKNSHHALELLLELLTQLGRPIEPATREVLELVKAGGKSGKLVKQLLALETIDNGAMESAREAMLAVRIARAERWAASN